MDDKSLFALIFPIIPIINNVVINIRLHFAGILHDEFSLHHTSGKNVLCPIT